MKKKALILISLIVILIILIGTLVCLINSDKNETFVGEVVHICYNDIDKYERCYVYLKPTFDSEREDLVLFEITKETAFESGFEGVLIDSPELKIGNTVEISFDKRKKDWENFKAKSIGSKKSDSITTNALLPIPKSDYSFDDSNLGITIKGKVIHVAEYKSSSLNGYILYVEEYSSSPLSVFWIDENTIVSDEAKEYLLSRKVGYNIKVKRMDVVPFDNSSCFILPAFSLNITD